MKLIKMFSVFLPITRTMAGHQAHWQRRIRRDLRGLRRSAGRERRNEAGIFQASQAGSQDGGCRASQASR